MNRVILSVSGELVQNAMNSVDTIYVIQGDYTLKGESITIPSNCTLDFQGGSLSNGTLVGNKTMIVASPYKIFQNITISGTWLVNWAYAEWFGALGDGTTDDTVALNLALTTFKNVQLGSRCYYCNGTITLTRSMSLRGVNKLATTIQHNHNSDAIVITGATLRDLTINVNGEYENEERAGVKLISTAEQSETTEGGEHNATHTVIEDIIIRMPYPAINSTFNNDEDALKNNGKPTGDGVGLYVLSVSAGIYSARINRIDVYRAKEGIRLHTTNHENSWINGNFFGDIKMYACRTALKFVKEGSVQYIRSNYFKFIYQNEYRFKCPTGKVFDVPECWTHFSYNVIECVIWDLMSDMSGGAILGNAGMNKVIDINSSCWMNCYNRYYFIGTIPANEGWGCVDIEFNNFHVGKEKMRLSYVKENPDDTSNNPLYVLRCVYREPLYELLISGIKYIVREGDVYIYIKSNFPGYIRANYSNEGCFTPAYQTLYLSEAEVNAIEGISNVNLNYNVRTPSYI